MIYTDVIEIAAKARAEREVEARRFAERRRQELRDAAAQADREMGCPFNWLPHLPYLEASYKARIHQDVMAAQLSAATGHPMTAVGVSNALKHYGIVQKRRGRWKGAEVSLDILG